MLAEIEVIYEKLAGNIREKLLFFLSRVTALQVEKKNMTWIA